MRILFYNGNIYRPKYSNEPQYHSFLVEDGSFVDFFIEKEPSVECDETISLNSLFVYPPFFDSHTHFVWGGSALTPLNFHQIHSKQEIIQRILHMRSQMEHQYGRGWLIGLGLDPHKVQISREELDQACGPFPCIIDTHDLHSAFANRIALERAKVWEECQNPPGGIIERDETGIPNGWLREFAVQFVKQAIPPATTEDHFQWYQAAETLAHSYGIVGVGENANTFLTKDYIQWDQQGKLNLRVDLWLNEGRPNERTLQFSKYQSHRLQVRTQKLFLDGSLGSRTAYMKEPYENQSDCGMPLMTFEEVLDLSKEALRQGWELAIHCIGDAAVEMAIEMAEVLDKLHFNTTKIALEHCQVLPENAAQKIARLGLTVSMQPVHLANDRHWMREKIGFKRCQRSFQFKPLSESKVLLRFGSDWPVEDLNPILGLKMAVENDSEEHPEKIWYQPHQLPFDAALEAFTFTPHQRAGWKNHCKLSLGKHSIGTTADFILINCDLQNTPTTDWSLQPVVQTWLEGVCYFVKS